MGKRASEGEPPASAQAYEYQRQVYEEELPQEQSAQGPFPHGQPLPGQYSHGQTPQGQYPHGQHLRGHNPQGQYHQGQYPRGQLLQGQHPHGQLSHGQLPRGQSPHGQLPNEQPSQGRWPQVPFFQGQIPREQSPHGQLLNEQPYQGRWPQGRFSHGQPAHVRQFGISPCPRQRYGTTLDPGQSAQDPRNEHQLNQGQLPPVQGTQGQSNISSIPAQVTFENMGSVGADGHSIPEVREALLQVFGVHVDVVREHLAVLVQIECRINVSQIGDGIELLHFEWPTNATQVRRENCVLVKSYTLTSCPKAQKDEVFRRLGITAQH